MNDEAIRQKLRTSKLWDRLTDVYYCDSGEIFANWWKRWCDNFPPRGSVWREYRLNAYETAPVLQVHQTSTVYAYSAFISSHVFLDTAGLMRWQLAREGLKLDRGLGLDIINNPMFVPHHIRRTKLEPAVLVTRRLENWPSLKAGLISSRSIPAIILVTLTGLYGALHAICWHSHFPSAAEQVLWRASSVIIAIGPLMLSFIFPMVQTNEEKEWQGALGLLIIGGICAVTYGGARLFILTEAFISLRSLQAGAYQTPNWTSWLLHL